MSMLVRNSSLYLWMQLLLTYGHLISPSPISVELNARCFETVSAKYGSLERLLLFFFFYFFF